LTPVPELAYWEARARALSRAFDADPNILLVGGYLTLPFNPPDGLLERYMDRVLWTPTSEAAGAGFAIGAAIGGFRPLVAVNTSSFLFYAWPQIVSEAPNVRYLSGGRARAPVVFHMFAGSRRAGGVQHEHTPHAMLQNVPGLRIFAPATPEDVDALIHAAFETEDPVVFIDHVLLAPVRGRVPDHPDPRVGRASMLRDGRDVLIVSYSYMIQRALEAADRLSERGIDCSVLNLRTIVPLPVEDVLEAAGRHQSVLFVDESRAAGSPCSLLMARVLERGASVRARLVCTLDAPAPFALELLDTVVPTTERIVEEIVSLTRPASS
ncbi:MAG: transketolase C-terminal domain-containing protein, partial [Actinomycetota bacterium]